MTDLSKHSYRCTIGSIILLGIAIIYAISIVNNDGPPSNFDSNSLNSLITAGMLAVMGLFLLGVAILCRVMVIQKKIEK